MPDYRAVFDATVAFANGGGLTAQGFRLDLPTGEETPERIAELFVQHLGLAMVASVDLAGLEIVAETHKGSRDRHRARAGTAPDRRSQPRHPRGPRHLPGSAGTGDHAAPDA